MGYQAHYTIRAAMAVDNELGVPALGGHSALAERH
jgi:hypothetical protein